MKQNFKNLIGPYKFFDELGFLKGYRAIPLCTLFWGHTLITNLHNPTNNPKDTYDAFNGSIKTFAAFIPVGPGWFITISSLLSTKVLWNAFEKGHKINYGMFYISRYLKIAVPIFFLIMIDKFIIKDWIGTFVQTPVYYPQKDTSPFLPLTFIQNYIWNMSDYVSSDPYF